MFLKLLFTKVYTCTLKYKSEMKILFYLLLLVIIFSEFEGYGEQQLHVQLKVHNSFMKRQTIQGRGHLTHNAIPYITSLVRLQVTCHHFCANSAYFLY